MGILDRLVPSPHAKVVDGMHPGAAQPDSRDTTPTAEILPLATEPGRPAKRRNILISVSGTKLDQELVSLACQIAREKRDRKNIATSVVAVYGIQVPQTLPIDAEMTEETREANTALDTAQKVAAGTHTTIEPEIIQSRHYGQSLVEEADSHECALLILGLPYRMTRSGRFEMGEVAEYVLKNASCRVWIVRGQPDEAETPRTNEDARQHALT